MNIHMTTLTLGLFSSYNIENTQVKLVIHAWFAWPTKSVCPAKVIWLTALFSNSKHFFHMTFVFSHQPANTMWWRAKVPNFL